MLPNMASEQTTCNIYFMKRDHESIYSRTCISLRFEEYSLLMIKKNNNCMLNNYYPLAGHSFPLFLRQLTNFSRVQKYLTLYIHVIACTLKNIILREELCELIRCAKKSLFLTVCNLHEQLID